MFYKTRDSQFEYLTGQQLIYKINFQHQLIQLFQHKCQGSVMHTTNENKRGWFRGGADLSIGGISSTMILSVVSSVPNISKRFLGEIFFMLSLD